MPFITDFILLLVSLVFGTAKNISSKVSGKAFSGIRGLMKVNAATGILAVVVYLISGADLSVIRDLGFIALALLYGLLTLGSQSFYMLAVKDGSVSVCSLIYASCFIIPTVFSAFYSDESFSVTKIFGILLMLTSILMVSYRTSDKKGGIHGILLAVCAMLCAGGVGIIQKVFADIFGKENTDGFLLYSFFFMLAISLVCLCVFGRGRKEKSTMATTAVHYVCAGLLCSSVVLANRMNIYLAGVLPGLLFFPVINGGTIIASAVMSHILFGERLSRLAISGILTGLSAMILIAI